MGRGRNRDEKNKRDIFAHYARYGQQTNNRETARAKQEQSQEHSASQQTPERGRNSMQLTDVSESQLGHLPSQPNAYQERTQTPSNERAHDAPEMARKVEHMPEKDQQDIARASSVFARYGRSYDNGQDQDREQGRERDRDEER